MTPPFFFWGGLLAVQVGLVYVAKEESSIYTFFLQCAPAAFLVGGSKTLRRTVVTTHNTSSAGLDPVPDAGNLWNYFVLNYSQALLKSMADASTIKPLLTSRPRRLKLSANESNEGSTRTLCKICTAKMVDAIISSCCNASIHCCDK